MTFILGALKIAMGWKRFALYILFVMAFAFGCGLIVNIWTVWTWSTSGVVCGQVSTNYPRGHFLFRSPVSVQKPFFLAFSSLQNSSGWWNPICRDSYFLIFGTEASIALTIVHENFWIWVLPYHLPGISAYGGTRVCSKKASVPNSLPYDLQPKQYTTLGLSFVDVNLL